MRHDKMIGEYTRTARRMPTRIARAGDFWIRHDPDVDRRAAVKKAIDFTERQRQADEAERAARSGSCSTLRDSDLQAVVRGRSGVTTLQRNI